MVLKLGEFYLLPMVMETCVLIGREEVLMVKSVPLFREIWFEGHKGDLGNGP